MMTLSAATRQHSFFDGFAKTGGLLAP